MTTIPDTAPSPHSSISHALAVLDHAQGALHAATDRLLALLAASNEPIIVSRRGERSVLAPLQYVHGFYTCGRFVFTPQKVHGASSTNGYVTITIL